MHHPVVNAWNIWAGPMQLPLVVGIGNALPTQSSLVFLVSGDPESWAKLSWFTEPSGLVSELIQGDTQKKSNFFDWKG